MSIDRYHHALPAEVTFEGKVYPLYNFGQLDRCNKASLKSRALDLCDGVGRDRLPPLNYHNKEDMIVWILQVESALALGQGLRGPFGDQVTPLTLGMPKNYVEDNKAAAVMAPTAPIPRGSRSKRGRAPLVATAADTEAAAAAWTGGPLGGAPLMIVPIRRRPNGDRATPCVRPLH